MIVVGLWNWKYNGQDEGVQFNLFLSLSLQIKTEEKAKYIKFLLICKTAHMQLRNVENYW